MSKKKQQPRTPDVKITLQLPGELINCLQLWVGAVSLLGGASVSDRFVAAVLLAIQEGKKSARIEAPLPGNENQQEF